MTRFESLHRERCLLIADVLEAETALYHNPEDAQLAALDSARRRLDTWNNRNATEYNTLKPWYAARAGRRDEVRNG